MLQNAAGGWGIRRCRKMGQNAGRRWVKSRYPSGACGAGDGPAPEKSAILVRGVAAAVEDLPHFAREGVGQEWFLQEGGPGLRNAVVHDGLVGVSRNIEHVGEGAQRRHL